METMENSKMQFLLLKNKKKDELIPDEQVIDIDYSELRSMNEIKLALIDKIPYFQSECARIDLLKEENIERKNTLIVPFINSTFTGRSSVTKELLKRNVALSLKYNPILIDKYVYLSENRPVSTPPKTDTDLFQDHKSSECCISISTSKSLDLITINYVVRLLHKSYLKFCF